MLTNSMATNQLKSLGRADEGQALVLGALGLVVLALMAGLGIDVGLLRYQKQQMQKAADAGAVAGASTLIYNLPGSQQVITAAQNDTAANGFTDGSHGISVQVNNPPLSGPFIGLDAYVEVIVTQAQPTFFMRVGGFNSVNVSSRAVASSVASSSACMYALDPTDADSLVAEGAVSVNSTCGIRVNSNSQAAFDKRGSGNIDVTQGGIGIVGNINESGSGGISPTPVTGIPPFVDPLAGVPGPALTPCRPQLTITQPGTRVQAATYCNGIVVETNGPVIFESGTYILIGGGLTVSPLNHPTLIGSDVTFYDTWNAAYPYAPVILSGSEGTTLSAPTSGQLAGILFFQDRSVVDRGLATLSSFDASHGELYTGALYFPTTTIAYTGNRTFPPYTIIDAWNVVLIGTSAIGNNYSSLQSGASPIHSAALVE